LTAHASESLLRVFAVPIYEYTCEQCETKFEKLVRSMSSAGGDKPACPKCGSTQTGRSLSVFAVGAEGAKSSGASPAPGMCGRCGGPGPCGMG
jgi:putative FmdB family regulatory protein